MVESTHHAEDVDFDSWIQQRLREAAAEKLFAAPLPQAASAEAAADSNAPRREERQPLQQLDNLQQQGAQLEFSNKAARSEAMI